MNAIRFPALFVAFVAAVGCTQAVEDDDVTLAEDELGVKTATSFTLSDWGKDYDCAAYSTLTVDLAASRLDGAYCENGTNVLVRRWLPTAEVTSLRSALAKVKTTAQSGACGPLGITHSLSVTRGANESKYVDVANSCAASGMRVTEASLAGLSTLTKSIAKKGPRTTVPGGTNNGRPYGIAGGTCVDNTAKPAYVSFGGITFSYDELGPHEVIRWDGSGVHGGRAGDVLTEYLRGHPVIGLGGVSHETTVWSQWSPVGREDVIVTGKLEDDKLWVTMGTRSGRFSCRFEVPVK